MPLKLWTVLAVMGLGLSLAGTATGGITDLTGWTLVEDPADPNMSASVDSATQVTLTAAGPVPNATDIGYQSVNALTPAASTLGYAFDPADDFAIAIDYELSFTGQPLTGGVAIGFGIGEDGDGQNSAGIVLTTHNGASLGAASAARINDITQPISPIAVFPPLTGSFHISYDANTGVITAGIGGMGAASPAVSVGITAANSWNGTPLLTSLFLRSDATLGTPWTSGTATAEFSDPRVLSGSAVPVPEPGALALTMLGVALTLARRTDRS